MAQTATATSEDQNEVASHTTTIGDSTSADYAIVYVRAILDNDIEIPGIYTTVWQSGIIKDKTLTPATIQFINSSGQTYQILVSDYSHYNFDHWSDGTFKRSHDIHIGVGKTGAMPITLKAVYYLSGPQ